MRFITLFFCSLDAGATETTGRSASLQETFQGWSWNAKAPGKFQGLKFGPKWLESRSLALGQLLDVAQIFLGDLSCAVQLYRDRMNPIDEICQMMAITKPTAIALRSCYTYKLLTRGKQIG